MFPFLVSARGLLRLRVKPYAQGREGADLRSPTSKSRVCFVLEAGLNVLVAVNPDLAPPVTIRFLTDRTSSVLDAIGKSPSVRKGDPFQNTKEGVVRLSGDFWSFPVT